MSFLLTSRNSTSPSSPSSLMQSYSEPDCRNNCVKHISSLRNTIFIFQTGLLRRLKACLEPRDAGQRAADYKRIKDIAQSSESLRGFNPVKPINIPASSSYPLLIRTVLRRDMCPHPECRSVQSRLISIQNETIRKQRATRPQCSVYVERAQRKESSCGLFALNT